jgi:PAS domain S-box-containing protein
MRHTGVLCFIVLLLLLSVILPTTCISSETSSEIALTQEELSWIAEHPVINVRVSSSYPPFEFFDDGTYQGLAYDYLVTLGQRLGLNLQPVTDTAWGDALQRIKDKDGVDLILLITHTPERESFLNFTRDYITFPEVIFTRKGGQFVSGFKDLEGRLVATENDFVESEQLLRDISQVRLLETDTTAAALEAVALGKADAYIGSLAVGSYLIDKLGLVNLKIAAPAPYGKDSYAMGVRKDWPELVNILEKGFGSLSASDYQNSRNKWLAIRYEHGLNFIDIAKWALLVFIIALVFIFQLRRMVKHRTRELHDSRSLLQVVQDNSFQLTGLLTPKGVVCDINRTALDFIDTGREEIVGKFLWETPLWARSTAQALERVRQAIQRAARGETIRYEATFESSTGEIRFFDFTLKPVCNNFGDIIYLVPSGHDITELKALQAKAIHTSQLTSLGELAAGVAHEVNNPITGVINYSQLLLNKAGDDIYSKNILERIIKEADRVASIVKGLLSLARDDSVHFGPLSVCEVVDEALSLSSMQLTKDSIDIDVNRASNLPLIYGNARQLVQLFLNFISNSRYALNEKYPEGQAKKKLSISVERMTNNLGEFVRIIIHDSGSGIPKELLGRILNPFVTSKLPGQGTGLGLSICNDIVKNHGGMIDVESEYGNHTKFIIDFPAMKDTQNPEDQ